MSLGENFRDNTLLLNTRQLLIEPLKLVGESLVIDSHAMEDRRVQVVDVHWVFGDVVAEVVGLSEGDATFDSPSCHPHAEISRVVIATVIVSRQTALAVNGTSEFTSPYDQGVLEHSASLEVLDQRSDRLVDLLALIPNLTRKIPVLIPASVKELYDAHASFDESACQ